MSGFKMRRGLFIVTCIAGAELAGCGPASEGEPGVNRVGPMLTATTHPPAVGYRGGFRWNDGDMSTTQWIPQAFTAGVSGTANVAIASWHWAPTSPEKGVRISVADISDMTLSAVNYRHVLLVRPTSFYADQASLD